MANEVNVCQYWTTDEPEVCSHWSTTLTECTFRGAAKDANGNNVTVFASKALYCNLIGTAIECDQYDGTTIDPRCILPDPFRHACNRKTGKKWVTMISGAQYDEDGQLTQAAEWSFDDINEYNLGACDGAGTAVTCSGYSPYHLAFGRIQPQASLVSSTGYLTADELGYRLPLSYVIWNKRSELSRCYWWAGDSEEFSIDSSMGFINPIEFLCINTDPAIAVFADHRYDANGRYIPPCNGAHDECPGYTGICWKYCTTDKMQEGDKVLAEQILELRYYMKKDRWTEEKYNRSFADPRIFAWAGPQGIHLMYNNLRLNLDESIIDTLEIYQTDFNALNIESKEAPLTAGTPDQRGKKNYPTLVKELKELYLTPLIRNNFDVDGEDNNIFEVNNLEADTIPIFGDTFWYDSATYGLNLGDPDILNIMPIDLILQDSMADIEASYHAKPSLYSEFYDKLDCILTSIITCLPDKVAVDTANSKLNMFYMDMPTIFGKNIIFVFNKGSGTWEFDKVEVNKVLCAGVIAQRSFSIGGSKGKPIDRLPWYESNFFANHNDNGSIGFDFLPFLPNYGGGEVAYIYNDYAENVISSDIWDPSLAYLRLMYTYHKVTAYEGEDVVLTDENVKFFGNAGHALVTVPDKQKKLHNTQQDWDVEGDILLNTTDVDGTEVQITMIVHKQDYELEPNQVIIKPEDINDFISMCAEDTLDLGTKIYTYEKRSFGEPSDGTYTVIDDPAVASGTLINTAASDSIKMSGGGDIPYELREFSVDPMFISVVYKGSNGRIKGITRTKMITWVKQPFCRDVEIFYMWKASYTKTSLLPDGEMYGKRDFKESPENTYHTSWPGCGNHDLGYLSNKGPMWYPYNACTSYARYSIIGNLTEWDINIIEQFDGEHGEHGAFDMRMLGPDDHYGYTCGVHTRIWNCLADWSFCNEDKITDEVGGNVFVGYGRYRGGMNPFDYYRCVENDGLPPQFGNVNRDFLRSFRSTDCPHYYKAGDEPLEFIRLRKWMPLLPMYMFSDVTAVDISTYPYELYTLDYNSPFVDQMGLLLVDSKIDNVSINEKLDYDNRYEYGEVMETKSSLLSLRYPMLRNAVSVGLSGELTTWYRFKNYPEDPSKIIHYVWQEIWKDLERYIPDMSSLNCDDSVEVEDCYMGALYSIDNCDDVSSVGRHSFLNILYPDYKYNASLDEFKLVCDEGDYDVFVLAPTFKIEGDIIDEFFWILLGNGHYRAFDINGNWDPDGYKEVSPFGGANAYPDLYETCTTDPWVEDVTIFAEGYTNETTSKAEQDERMILDYDDIGDESKQYFQRGLNIEILPDKFACLPVKYSLLEMGDYDIRFLSMPDETFSIFENIEVGEWVDAQYCFDVAYYSGDNDVEMEFDITREQGEEDSGIGAISKVICTFTFGAEEHGTPPDLPENVWFGDLYHIPAVTITIGDNVVYSNSSMELATKNSVIETESKDYDFDLSASEIFVIKKAEATVRKGIIDDTNNPDNLNTKVKITFRITPTWQEREDAGVNDYYIFCNNKVRITCIYIYHANFMDAYEPIKTYERKYNVSYGSYGDFPPQGYDTSQSLLYPIVGEISTVYQKDFGGGVVGMPNSSGESVTMDKRRGRLMSESTEDKTPLPDYQTIYQWEALQKKLHDNVAIERGSDSFTMSSVCSPSLKDALAEIGMVFPSWGCVFTNTYVLPLAKMLLKDPYSPIGHEFHHNWESVDLSTTDICGKVGSISARLPRKDVFEYAFRNFGDAGSGWTSVDFRVAYVKTALASFFLNPLALKQADDRRPFNTDSSNRTTEDITSLLLPSSIDT